MTSGENVPSAMSTILPASLQPFCRVYDYMRYVPFKWAITATTCYTQLCSNGWPHILGAYESNVWLVILNGESLDYNGIQDVPGSAERGHSLGSAPA